MTFCFALLGLQHFAPELRECRIGPTTLRNRVARTRVRPTMLRNKVACSRVGPTTLRTPVARTHVRPQMIPTTLRTRVAGTRVGPTTTMHMYKLIQRGYTCAHVLNEDARVHTR